jgi:chromosomal replication initiation ATPase DnaA
MKDRSNNPNVPMNDIVGAVCGTLGGTFEEFHSSSRSCQVVAAREMVVALAVKLTRLSFPGIARAMRRPNHSTAYTALDRWERRLELSKSNDQSSFILIDGEAIDPQKVYEAIKGHIERTVAA